MTDDPLLLVAQTPLFSRELLRPLRLVSLAVGIVLLIAGSIWLPSADWDVPLCFVMAFPTYVLAPWAFRQVYYLRWRWMPLAGVAMWATIDGTYSLYWWLRGFDALAIFRPANFFYCMWLFWICGFIWNVDYAKMKLGWKCRLEGVGGRFERKRMFVFRLLPVIFLVVFLTGLVGCLCGFFGIRTERNDDDWIPKKIPLPRLWSVRV